MLIYIAIYYSSDVLILSERLNRYLEVGMVGSVLLQLRLWSEQLLHVFVDRLFDDGHKRSSPTNAQKGTLFLFFGRFLLYTTLLLVFLEAIGVNVTSLITGLGIGGIAVALAVKNILGDLFANISILLDKPFTIGDQIEVGDCKGRVEHIGIKTTRLRSDTGEQIIIPNSDILQARLRNYHHVEKRAGAVNFALAYETPFEKVSQVLERVQRLLQSGSAVKNGEVHLKRIGKGGIDFEVSYTLTSDSSVNASQFEEQLNLHLLELLQQLHVVLVQPDGQHTFVQVIDRNTELLSFPLRSRSGAEKDFPTLSTSP